VAAHGALIADLRARFAAHADAQRAPEMQRYMKSPLPFHGIPTPLRRQLTAEAVRAHPVASTAALADTMRTLWNEAAACEERYAAIELARTGTHRRLFNLDLLPMVEMMIVDGARWDFCDDLSANAVAELLRRHPQTMKPRLRQWAWCDDLWLRRAAILCQRGLKGAEFDAALLYDCIAPSIGPRPLAGEFFLRKGIGWALRERSYDAPDEVIAYCAAQGDALSPLTRREALKAIQRLRTRQVAADA
jgi:3-methyladenine DNA glycosylase AlkD